MKRREVEMTSMMNHGETDYQEESESFSSSSEIVEKQAAGSEGSGQGKKQRRHARTEKVTKFIRSTYGKFINASMNLYGETKR